VTRTRASAKKAGGVFERLIADYLALRIDDRIDRRVRTGAKDCGDISGLRVHGQRVVVEIKSVARTSIAEWVTEAHAEAGNDDALVGIVIAKRHGKGWPGEQWVHMTVDDLVALIMGLPVDDKEATS